METTTTSRNELEQTLRASGNRSTRPRRAVWQVLVDADAHLTVDQIADRLHQAGESVDLASVYRALGLFAELGLARETRLGDDAAHWERDHPDEHFHLVCRTCGGVDHHVGSLVQQIRDHLHDGHAFDAEDVELVVTGRCARCRAAG